MEAQLDNNHHEGKSKLRYLFGRLNSWREESQKEFSNIVNSLSSGMDKELCNLLKEVSDLQEKLSAITEERDNLVETVENMGREMTRMQTKMSSLNTLLDPDDSLYEGNQENDCHEIQDPYDAEIEFKLNNDNHEPEKTTDDEAQSPTFSSSEEISNVTEVNDKADEREVIKLSNKGLPEKETSHDDMRVHKESIYVRGKRFMKWTEVTAKPDEREIIKLSDEGLPEKETTHKKDMKVSRESINIRGQRFMKCKYWPRCSYVADSMSHMKDHVREKHEKVKFKCDECTFARSRKRDLMRHIREVHQIGKKGKHVCEDCGHAALNRSLLESHRLYVHDLKTDDLTLTDVS